MFMNRDKVRKLRAPHFKNLFDRSKIHEIMRAHRIFMHI